MDSTLEGHHEFQLSQAFVCLSRATPRLLRDCSGGGGGSAVGEGHHGAILLHLHPRQPQALQRRHRRQQAHVHQSPICSRGA